MGIVRIDSAYESTAVAYPFDFSARPAVLDVNPVMNYTAKWSRSFCAIAIEICKTIGALGYSRA